MALTLRSLASAAKRRAQRAHAHVEEARRELVVANEELEGAIPSGDVTRIRHAHERTQGAERAVAQASEELEVVDALLAERDEPVPSAGMTTSGEGVRSLVKSLRPGRSE